MIWSLTCWGGGCAADGIAEDWALAPGPPGGVTVYSPREERELEANAFAAAFLMPPAELRAGFAAGRMACRAPRIVGASLALERFVRIVAGDAAYTRVGGIVAPAVGQAIGLEAKIVHVMWAVSRNLRPRAVALAAKIRKLLGRQ